MNAERRKRIKYVINDIDDIISALDEIRNDEQDAYDNLPENFQESEKGEAMLENIDSLDIAMSNLEDVQNDLDLLLE